MLAAVVVSRKVSEMLVVDFHVHVGEREHWHPWVHELLRRVNPGFEERWDEVMSSEGLEDYLRDEGVSYACVLAEYSPITTGIVPNEYVADLCQGKEMLLPFASIDPKTVSEPALELERCVKKLRFKGLKLYPTYQQYYPNERTIYPLYAKAEELGIPVMIHTGSSVLRGARIKYGNPVHIDDVAVDFPDLEIIMVHSGRGFWYDEAFWLARQHENVYMEIAGLPPQNLLKYFPDLERNADKVIFGSDWPFVPGIAQNIRTIRELPLDESTIAKILGLNAARILGIEE